jgi:ribosomal protein L15
MEITLGKQHTQSPFTPIFQKYGFSTEVKKEIVEEVNE